MNVHAPGPEPDPHQQAVAVPPAEEDPVARARTLGRRLGIARTPGDDKSFADAIVARLREDRLLWAAAPRDRDGLGLPIGAIARVTFHVGRLSGSAGLIYAMHMSQALSVIRHGGDGSYFSSLLDWMVRDQVLVASGTSEKGVGGDIFGSICQVETDDDGTLRVTKESPNISYLDHAGALLVTAMRSEAKGKPSQVLIAADMRRVDLRPGRDGAFMGMRGILNRPYAFTARFGPEAVFRETYPVIARETMTPTIHILWAALWSGLACQILDKVKAYIAKEMSDGTDAQMARVHASRLVERHHMMNALIRDAIADFNDDGGATPPGVGLKRTARVKRLKLSCSELLAEVCDGALELVGLRGYADVGLYSLSEPLRDAMSARIMVSNHRMRLGNAELERYIEEEL